MQIRLVDYKEGVAKRVHEDYNPKRLELEFVDWAYTQPLHMEGSVEKGMDTVTFRGRLDSEIDQSCGRCLAVRHRRLSVPFELFYEIAGREMIETLEDLREVCLLDHPLSFLCREDCRGLCSECGKNRNEENCACESRKPKGPLLSSLKEIWNQSQKEKRHG